MRLFFAAMTTLLVAVVEAQDVRPMSSAPSFVRASYRQAQKEGRDWSDLSGGEDGTLVHFSGDGDNADMIVASSAGEDRVLAAVRDAAIAAGFPKTDYLKRHGTVTASADAEFNKYLSRSGRDTRFSFPLKRLLASLKASKLPRPMVVVIEKEGQLANLTGPKGTLALTKDRTLFSIEELAGYESLENRFHLDWWAPIAAGALMLSFLGIFAVIPAVAIRSLRKKAVVGAPAPPPTPEEVQAAYDVAAKVPAWRKSLLSSPVLLLMPMFLMISSKSVAAQAFSAMPRWFKEGVASPWLLVGFVALSLPMILATMLRGRKVRKEVPDVLNPLGGMWPMFVGLFFMMGLLVIVRVKPDLFRPVPPEYRTLLIFSVPALMGGLSAFLMWRGSRGASRSLPDDDPLAAMTRELGARAGVRVRRVIERKHGGPNAFATLFGTVGVTTKLRETLDEDETRAVIAHEIGHLKASDPWRFLALTLPPTVALYGVWWWIEVRTPFGDNPTARLALQMFFWFGLPALFARAFSPRRRKAEHAADLFALEQTGDVELVSRALFKIHDANLAPHRLHPRDERVASHPALEKRLERLREAAGKIPSAEGRS